MMAALHAGSAEQWQRSMVAAVSGGAGAVLHPE